MTTTVPGRNKPCECGSGKKFKLCCGRTDPQTDAPRPTQPSPAPYIDSLLQQAVAGHRRGDLGMAETLYRQILAADPGHADALHLLGVLAHQSGHPEVALRLIDAAIAINGRCADYYNNRGAARHATGDLDGAAADYATALRLAPPFADAHYNLGSLHHDRGLFAEAATCYRAAITIKPDYATAHGNLGNTLRLLGDLDGALASCRTALRLTPQAVTAHNNLGAVLLALGDDDGAEAALRQALVLQPDYTEAHTNLGSLLERRGDLEAAATHLRAALRVNPRSAAAHNNLGKVLSDQGALAAALKHYRAALYLKPDGAEIHNNLGIALQQRGEREAAQAHFQQALALKPDFVEALNNLGNIYQSDSDMDAALRCYGAALAIKPDYAEAHNNVAGVLAEGGDFVGAIAAFRTALQYKPGYPEALASVIYRSMHLCAWEQLESDYATLRNVLQTDPHAVAAPFNILALSTDPADQLLCARSIGQNRLTRLTALRDELGLTFTSAPRDRLHIGYLSADFRSHPVARLIVEAIELHDRDRFTVTGYGLNSDDSSPERARLIAACDHFVDLHAVPPFAAAQRIHADGVDLLVDLTGYTYGGRCEIVALHPAPVQVNFLGYPGTMGADFMDYLIADRTLIPDEAQQYYSERIAYLPDTYQPNDRQRPIAARPTRAQCALPEEGVVFCAFNNTYKITPDLWDRWMRLLVALPGSVLWLLEAHPLAEANLRREAEVRGVDATRLIFAPRVDLPAHLARCAVGDLFLDTFPYTGHTTASDALWAGLPLLTCPGQTFASRVATSLLRAAGLPELVADSLDDYEQQALYLATHPDELAALRTRLIARRDTCALFDTPRYTRGLEEVYRQMWTSWAAQHSAGGVSAHDSIPHGDGVAAR